MKAMKSTLILLTFLMLTATPVFAATVIYQANNPKMSVNGITKDIDAKGTKPVIIDGNILVPLRPLIEGLGGTVEWDAKDKKITLTLGSEKSAIWLNSNQIKFLKSADENINEYFVKGNELWEYPGATASSINNITMVPISVVSYALSVNSNWFDYNRLAVIYTETTPGEIIPPGESASWGDSATTIEDAIQNLYNPKIGPGLPYMIPLRDDYDDVRAEMIRGYALTDLDKDGYPEFLLDVVQWEGSYQYAYAFKNGKMKLIGRIHADWIEDSTGYIISTGGEAGYTPDIAYKYENGEFKEVPNYVTFAHNYDGGGYQPYLMIGGKRYDFDPDSYELINVGLTEINYHEIK